MTEFLDALQAPGGVLRHTSAVLCIAAFGFMVWRLLGRWQESGYLLRTLAGLLAALELLAATGTARAAALQAPVNETQYAIIVHALAVILAAIYWPHLERLPLPSERRHP